MGINWDQAYADGVQDGWAETDSSPRYALIGGICTNASVTEILDVGCGTGLLRSSLCPHVSRYTGLDCSSVAIGCLRAKGNETFVCADAEHWVPSQYYDAVILNEVLYYFENPRLALSKYRDAVSPGGIMIVSVWKRPARFLRPNPNLAVINVAKGFLPFTQYEVSDGDRTWVVLVWEKGQQR